MINLKRSIAAKKAVQNSAYHQKLSGLCAEKMAIARSMLQANMNASTFDINQKILTKYTEGLSSHKVTEIRKSLGIVKVGRAQAYALPAKPAAPFPDIEKLRLKTPVNLDELTKRVTETSEVDSFTQLLRQLRDAMRGKDIVKVIVTTDGATLKREVSEYVSLK